MEDKEKLKSFIKNSALAEKDKLDWDTLIETSSEEFAQSLYEILDEFPTELGWFNNIYKRKKLAFAVLKENKPEGEALLKDIYQEEREKLEELLSC